MKRDNSDVGHPPRLGDSLPNVWNQSQTNLSAVEMSLTPAQASPQNNTIFHHSDHLGSARIMTAGGGWPVSFDTFYPFGLEQTSAAPGDNSYRFAGLDRDSESQQDHTAFRQLAYLQGRWTSPDPYDGSYDVTNPQSFNRYAYVLNNPLSYIDPLGLELVVGDDDCIYDWTGTTLTLVSCGSGGGGGGGGGNSGGGGRGGVGGGKGKAPSKDPCANSTLTAAGVNIQQNISQANLVTRLGAILGAIFSDPFSGALTAYGSLVQTGGPQDVKNQPGPGTSTQRVDAGNISYGVTCPFGGAFCQFAAGAAQTFAGRPNPNGTLKTGFDTPTDNTAIRQGQAMRAAGCHG